jgi:hypothetical protein
MATAITVKIGEDKDGNDIERVVMVADIAGVDAVAEVEATKAVEGKPAVDATPFVPAVPATPAQDAKPESAIIRMRDGSVVETPQSAKDILGLING